jgi:hypothetical protein
MSHRDFAYVSVESFCCVSCRIHVSWLLSSEFANQQRGGLLMAAQPIALRTLLRQKHWKYATFCTEFDKAAKSIDPSLTGSWPSRAQF